MDSIIAIGVGLVLRVVVDVATENDDRVGGVLVGLWEGVVLNHFVRQMPRSYDPYLGFGFRIFVDFLFTQSLSRLALVALWALVGMLLADIAPNFWRDSGLRHIYRQVRKDVRHVKRSVPHIRIKNDLPSVRLFTKSRSASSDASSSIRSDRAVPSRSPARSPAPIPGPSRRPGRSPPGALPDTSGWSETNSDVSNVRTRIVMSPGPSPALIPSREHATYERVDNTARVATSREQTTTIQETVTTTTQIQNESVFLRTAAETTMLGAAASSMLYEPLDDQLRHTIPAIPDDWVDIEHPTPVKPNQPVAPFKPDPDSTPEAQPKFPSPPQSPPLSILEPPPPIDVLPDIPDADHFNRASHPPAQIPLPESRAASEIGGMFDQPQPRSVLRGNLRADKATSEIGVAPARTLTPIVESSSTRSSHSFTSWAQAKFGRPVSVNVPEPPPKDAQSEPAGQSKPEVEDAARIPEPQTSTPAQVDPPPSILTQPRATTPLLFTAEPAPEQPQATKLDQPPVSAGVDSSPAAPQVGASTGDTARRRQTSESLLDLPIPSCTPPPPFTEFAGVLQGPAAGEAPTKEDPIAQDEVPTELTQEQKAAEEKRLAFLLTQVQELEGQRASLTAKLDKEDDPASSPANAIETDLKDTEESLNSIKARMAKKKFSDPPSDPSIPEVPLANKSVTDVQLAITSAVLDMLLKRDDAGPMTIQAIINRQKPPRGKAKDAKDAVMAIAKRHKFAVRSEIATPGIINITF